MGERVPRYSGEEDEEESQRGAAGELISTRVLPTPTKFHGGVSRGRLFLSLLSGLPNEQELALGGLALHPPPLSPHLLEVLVAQAGVWIPGGSLDALYSESWRGVEGRRMDQFWHTALQQTPDEALGSAWEMGSEGRRVHQVALILHNLSFEAENVQVLGNSAIFIRFLLMCLHCPWSNLKQIAFDTLANIAEEVCVGAEEEAALLEEAVRGAGVAGDRFVVLRALDALAQMAPRHPHLLSRHIRPQVCWRLVSLLSVGGDVLLLHLALECLRALSTLPSCCDPIARTPGVIGVLVSLLSVEPGLRGVTLVERSGPLTQAEEPPPTLPPLQPVPSRGEVSSETFATNWLRGQYAVGGDGGVPREEVYAAYVRFCGQAQRTAVLPAATFADLLRASFPGVELVQGCFQGLRRRGHTGVTTQAAVLSPSTSSLPLQVSSKISESPVQVKSVQKNGLPIHELSQSKLQKPAPCKPIQPLVTQQSNNGAVHSPLLNGLLDRKPKRDILLHALLENGIRAAAPPPPPGGGMVRMTAAAQDGGVVALHIESPDASNEGTDLSPLPDIARTLERASLALSPQEPPLCNATTVSASKHSLVQNGGTVAASDVRSLVVSTPGTNSVASEVAGLGAAVVNSAAGNFFRTVAVNSVPGGQGVRTIALNSISNNNVRTLAVNSVAGNVIRPISLNSVAGNLVGSRSENVPVNSVSVLNQGVGTVVVNSVAGSVLSPATLALNSVGGNVVRTLSVNPGQDIGSLSLNSVGGNVVRTLSVNPGQDIGSLSLNSVGGNVVRTLSVNPGQDIGSLSLNSVTGNVIRTVAVNSLPGQGNVTLHSGAGNRQQIFVVASPGGGAPNIKFCILHAVPNAPPPPPLKRPSSESPAPVIKKPCTPPPKREVEPSAEARPPTQLEFLCEWKNCRMRFPRAGEVLVHVAHAHCTQEEGPCAWEGCTAGGRRKRLSLLTHLQDWHCSERLVRLASNRRRVATLPPPPQPPPHPGYAPDAALAAIRRRHPKEPLRVPEEEGALAKSVHLTAALVLRNLLTHSEWARRCARRFEPELACAAMSGGEASRALAQCLARLHPC